MNSAKDSLHLVHLKSKEDLMPFLDDFVEGARFMLEKTGARGQSVENFVRLTMAVVGLPTSFVLVAVKDGRLRGFLVANCIMDPGRPWVEIMGLCISPTLNKNLRILSRKAIQTASDELCKWANGLGAKSIYAGVIRIPDRLFKHFFAPLGYHRIGYIIEKEL